MQSDDTTASGEDRTARFRRQTIEAARKAHAEAGCTCQLYSHDDPDCELHHPDAIETDPERRVALEWYGAGFESALTSSFTPREATLLLDLCNWALDQDHDASGMGDPDYLSFLIPEPLEDITDEGIEGVRSALDTASTKLGRLLAETPAADASEAAAVREALHDDPTVSNEDYGRLVEEASEADEARVLNMERARAIGEDLIESEEQTEATNRALAERFESVAIPYNLRAEDLKVEPDTNDAQYHEELSYISHECDEAEAERILRAAILLFNHTTSADGSSPTLGDCLYTAIVWERG